MKVVIYTALIGKYDNLIEPNFSSNNIDFICFTDQNFSSKVWNIEKVALDGELSATSLNRFYKMKPHELFPEYDISIYVDSNIFLKADIQSFLHRSLENHLVAAPRHLLRDCIYEESKKIISQGRANSEQVLEQVNRYRDEGMPLKFGLCEMNIIFRRHNHPEVIRLMELWYHEFSIGVKRDQLSFFYCVWKLNMIDKINFLKINSRKNNEYFMAVPHLNENLIKKAFYKAKVIYSRVGGKI